MIPAKKLISIFDDIFVRPCLFQSNIFSGTTKPKEVWSSLLWLLSGNDGLMGDYIDKFEKQLAQYLQVLDCVCFAAGRMALYAILESLNIGQGDEVIVPAYTCVVVPNAIIYRGAKPVYCDIETERFGIDPARLEQCITPRTRAIIAQHTYGIPCRMKEITEVARKHQINVIEDCAHALGGKLDDEKLGSIAPISFSSLDYTKIISTGTGGFASTKDPELARKIRQIKQRSGFITEWQLTKLIFGYSYSYILSNPYIFPAGKYIRLLLDKLKCCFDFKEYLYLKIPDNYPYPARLTNIQSKLGLSQLSDLNKNLDHRREIVRHIDAVLKANQSIINDESLSPSWLRYPFLVENRSSFLKKTAKYFQFGIWFCTIAQNRRDHFEQIHYTKGSCPVAEWVTNHIVSIPTHYRIKGLDRLCEDLTKLKPVRNKNNYFVFVD
jgi:dTDP-4-amino-4,6-dideoxygalactose transaminase